MLDILITYDTPEPETYGQVYFNAALILKNKGFAVSFLDIQEFVANYDFSDKYLQEFTAYKKPRIILSHQASLERTLRSHLGNAVEPTISFALEEEIERFILSHYQGRSQTNSHYNASKALEFKEGFVYRMRQEGIPIPSSIVRGVDIPESQWTYSFLNKSLNQEAGQQGIIVKDVTGSKGQGVHFLQEDIDLLKKPTIRVAQRRILSDNPFPCSLRFITFPGRIIATFFYYSRSDSHRSNLPDNYKKIIINDKKIEQLRRNDPLILSLLPQNGFTQNLCVREDIRDLAVLISSLHSQSLLRGIDMIFDSDGNPYVLEAQTNPGHSWGSNYSLIAGLKQGTKSHNLSVASWVIAHELAEHMKK